MTLVRKSEFSLRTLTLSSAAWWATVPAGWALILLAVYHTVTVSSVAEVPAFVMTLGLLVLLELLPLVAGRGHDPEGVVMSTAFVCAMLFMWGVWPAVISVGVASLAADLRARKDWWKVLFNPAQYALSVSAAYSVMLLLHGPIDLVHPLPRIDHDDLVWVPLAWLAYFVVNLLIVDAVVSFSGPFRTILFEDL